MRALFLATAATLSFAVPVWAGSATNEEAKRVERILQSYSGNTPGFALAAPEGEAYRIRLDFGVLLDKILAASEAGISVNRSMTSEFLARPLGNGQWQISQNAPFAWSLDSGKFLAVTIKAESLTYSGVFDENLRAFVSQTADAQNLTFSQYLEVPDEQPEDVTYTIDAMHYASSAKDAGSGAVDGTSKYTFKGLKEVVRLANEDGSFRDVTISSPGGEQTMKIAGLKTGALLDLVRWTFNNVQTADPNRKEPDLDAMRDVIAAALPVFGKLSGGALINNLSVESPFGVFGIAKMGFDIELNGVVSDGLLRESFTFEDVTLPASLPPEWTNGLIPQNMNVDFRVSGYDLAKPAEIILANFRDFVVPLGSNNLEEQLIKAAVPSGAFTIGLAALDLKSPLYDVALDGAMQIGLATVPEGKGTLRAKSLLPLIEALKKTPAADESGQLVPVLIMLNSIARKESDGSLRWDIDGTPDGKFVVNGIDYAALAKLGSGIPDQE